MLRSLKAFVAVSCMMTLAACSAVSGNSWLDDSTSSEQEQDGDLKIVAATELAPLEPVLEQASEELGFDITMTTESGTLENSRSLQQGTFDRHYDATWFATNRYARIIGADSKLGKEFSVARSPVALGVHKDVARKHGWDTTQPTWQEISDSGITFGMTDPSTSNSGFSALSEAL